MRYIFKVVRFCLSFKLASFEDNIEIHITALEIAIGSHRGLCCREMNFISYERIQTYSKRTTNLMNTYIKLEKKEYAWPVLDQIKNSIG